MTQEVEPEERRERELTDEAEEHRQGGDERRPARSDSLAAGHGSRVSQYRGDQLLVRRSLLSQLSR